MVLTAQVRNPEKLFRKYATNGPFPQVGAGSIGDHLDAYIANPASEAEADWASLTPGAPGLKPKRTSQ
jgi:hypothetical protein